MVVSSSCNTWNEGTEKWRSDSCQVKVFYLKTNFNTYNNNFAFCHLNENILTFSNKKPAHVFTTSSRENSVKFRRVIRTPALKTIETLSRGFKRSARFIEQIFMKMSFVTF